MSNDKEIRADAKLKNLPEAALQELWRFRNPEEGGEKLTMAEICAEIPRLYQFSVSLSTLSDFYSWLRLQRRMESAAERASQARLALAKDPQMSPEMLVRVGQMVFTAETIEDGNVKAYVELVKLQLQAAKQEIDRAKITAASKTKIEDGLEALFKEIKGNKKAEALFKQLQEVVAKA